MNEAASRLAALRAEMKQDSLSAYIIPTSDFHDTEYVAEYFAARKHFSGFTGSAGTLVVLADKAALWTDGRYFIQAARELEGSGIELMRMGEEGTPTIMQYLEENLKAGDTVGFDGRTVSFNEAREWKRKLAARDIQVETGKDLISRVWTDRPAMPATRTFPYPIAYAGKSVSEKLADVRSVMKEEGARAHVITKVDEIIWLFNFRADEIPCFPAALSYALITPESATLYIDEARVDPETREQLKQAGVSLSGYDRIYEDVKVLEGPVMLDPSFVNSTLAQSLPQEPLEMPDPIVAMKAVKNEAELAATREAHLKDAVAVTEFMYWLKHLPEDAQETEVSAADYLQNRRKAQEGYFEDSFSTISAYRENAAMMHYHPGAVNVPLKKEGMLLVDSGGQYMDGTTDITRTFVLGPITEEERKWFTKALRGHIRLEQAKFLQGCRGLNLDILARGPMWDEEIDYQCGTGHGVGHVSNVHEAPNGFRWRIVPERNDSCVLEPGMITSDEPGVYMEGKFGIRHENEILVKKAGKNRYGQFLEFEPLTFVPFDRDGLDPALMTGDEIRWLDDYHRQVLEKVGPRLQDEAIRTWLQDVTRPLQG
ncbi:aminopeptidase P family protein [uncultured Faecalibaculum sp.]|uniref:aminopeptidase P family protein n=1 Tax=uncultured Faecalibaculum sp. TaxID=1729681 RepID=UPI00272B4715|nr:aminopeptidase P family protein [uncultured Faecalibaculum sp.]